RASVTGLAGAAYVDKTDGMKRKTLGHGPFTPDAETDRVFTGARGACQVMDPVLGRRVVVDKRGSATTVVWNPWRTKAGGMADLGADEWRRMLCVETANAMDDAVTLGPGGRPPRGRAPRAAAGPAPAPPAGGHPPRGRRKRGRNHPLTTHPPAPPAPGHT